MDPPPKTSRIKPSVPSSSPSRALTKGIIGAQLDVAVPQIRNIALVARLAAPTFTTGENSTASDTVMRWRSPGASGTVATPTFAVSTHSIPRHSSSPKSCMARALAIHGFQTTVERELSLLTTMRRCRPGSSIEQVAIVSR